MNNGCEKAYSHTRCSFLPPLSFLIFLFKTMNLLSLNLISLLVLSLPLEGNGTIWHLNKKTHQNEKSHWELHIYLKTDI